MATIQDVARHAGVSVATVSRALNNLSSVRDETRVAVQQAVRELEYEPVRKLKSERLKNENTVMILIPDIANPFYAMITKGMADYAMTADYSLITCVTNLSERREKKYLELIKSELVSGAIFLAPVISTKEMLELNQHYNIVQCCEFKEDTEQISHLSIDNYAAGRDAVQHLINLGHKKIAMISCDNGFLSSKKRESAYIETLEKNNIPFDSDYLIRVNTYEYTNGMRGMNQLLNLDVIPTAVFAVSDFLAIGAIQSIQKHGLSVPSDIAVMGFDDIQFASMYTPSLTTIYQPQYDMGQTALKMLIEKVEDNSSDSRCLYFEHELRIRGSTVK